MGYESSDNLAVIQDGAVLRLTFTNEQFKNALSAQVCEQLLAIFEQLEQDPTVRIVLLRGAGGHFCSGGNLKDMASGMSLSQQQQRDYFITLNRTFGRMIQAVEASSKTIVCLLEGAVLGGGLGIACVADISIGSHDARLGMPETTRGIPPAQIAPFVMKKIGLANTRFLALQGVVIDGRQAQQMGLINLLVDSAQAMDDEAEKVIANILQCAPMANAITKTIIRRSTSEDINTLLDDAAILFTDALLGEEGREGTTAFVEKRPPVWAENNQ